MNTDFSYGVVPLYKDGSTVEVLLIQHRLGHWGFPKGHAEKNELPLEAAQRELQEETGITQYQLNENVTFAEEYYPQIDGEIIHKTVVYYPAWVSSKQVIPQVSEVSDYGWFDVKTAQEKISFDGAKKVMREVRAYLQTVVE